MPFQAVAGAAAARFAPAVGTTALSIAASDARDIESGFIGAAAALETYRATVRATESDSAAANRRLEELLQLGEQLVGIDVEGLIKFNSQLRASKVSAEDVNVILSGTTKSVAELGRGVDATAAVMRQLTDAINQDTLSLVDWRIITGYIPQIAEAASTALGTTVNSANAFRQAADDAGLSIRDALIATLTELDRTAKGADLSSYNAQVELLDESVYKLKAAIGEPIKDSLTPIISGLASAAQGAAKFIEGLSSSSENFATQAESNLARQAELIEERAEVLERLRRVEEASYNVPQNYVSRLNRERDRLTAEINQLQPDTSVGAFRVLENPSRSAERPDFLQTTPESRAFFSNLNVSSAELRLYQQRAAAGELAGTAADRLSDLNEELTDVSQQLVDLKTGEDTSELAQRRTENLQIRVGNLNRLIAIETALVREEERAKKEFQKAAEDAIKAIGEQAKATETATEAADKFNETMQGLADKVVLAGIEVQRAFSEDIADSNIGARATDIRNQQNAEALRIEEETASVTRRRFIDSLAGFPGVGVGVDRTFPSLAELQARETAAFRASAGPRQGDLERLVADALGSGTESIDYEALRQQYENYRRQRREGEREITRLLREQQRVIDRSFTRLSDGLIDVAFGTRELDDALKSIAQNTLKDFAQLGIRQLLQGSEGGGLNAGSFLSGGGGALTVASLLFPTEFSNLGTEITNSVQALFHDPLNDARAARAGYDVARDLLGSSPTARRNADDFSDNFADGFRIAAGGGNDSEGQPVVLEIHNIISGRVIDVISQETDYRIKRGILTKDS